MNGFNHWTVSTYIHWVNLSINHSLFIYDKMSTSHYTRSYPLKVNKLLLFFQTKILVHTRRLYFSCTYTSYTPTTKMLQSAKFIKKSARKPKACIVDTDKKKRKKVEKIKQKTAICTSITSIFCILLQLNFKKLGVIMH